MLDFNNAQPQRPYTGHFAGGDARTHADDPPRAYAPDNWTLDADAFECCCAACSSQDQ
jgi:hypothetical protein